ncbi:MAG: hypothetical protein OXC40_06635 [Proteobacteria bacterium]|nr:hypothetical protein [Pseudomonadota bacterium]
MKKFLLPLVGALLSFLTLITPKNPTYAGEHAVTLAQEMGRQSITHHPLATGNLPLTLDQRITLYQSAGLALPGVVAAHQGSSLFHNPLLPRGWEKQILSQVKKYAPWLIGLGTLGIYLANQWNTQSSLWPLAMSGDPGFEKEGFSQPSRELTGDELNPVTSEQLLPKNKPAVFLPLERDEAPSPSFEGPSQDRDSYHSIWIRQRLARLEREYETISSSQLRLALKSYVDPPYLAAVEPKSFLNQMYQSFVTKNIEEAACRIPSDLRRKYIFHRRIILKDTRKLADFSIVLDCKISLLRQDWAMVTHLLRQYRPPEQQTSQNPELASHLAPSPRLDTRPKYVRQTELTFDELKENYFKLTDDELRSLLKDLVNEEVLEVINKSNLNNYLNGVLTPSGWAIFLKDILHLSVYSQQTSQVRTSSDSKQKLILDLLQFISIERLESTWLSDYIKEIAGFMSQLDAIQVEPVMNYYYIDPSHSEELIKILNNLYQSYLNEISTIKTIILYKQITRSSVYSYARILAHFDLPNKVPTNRPVFQRRTIRSSTRELVAKEILFSSAALPKIFGSKDKLKKNQEQWLKAIQSAEQKDEVSDYRWHYTSHYYLPTRIEHFLTSLAVNNSQEQEINKILLLTAMHMPHMNDQNLSLLLDLTPAEIQQKSQQLFSLWQQQDVIHSIFPAQLTELENRFYRLSTTQWHQIGDLFGVSRTKTVEFSEKTRNFIDRYLMHNSMKHHLFFTFVLKMEVSSPLVKQQLFKLYNRGEEYLSFTRSIKNYIRFLKISFQHVVLDSLIDKPRQTRGDFYQDRVIFHQHLVEIYQGLTPAEIKKLAHKWGHRNQEDIELFRLRLDNLANYLMKNNQQNFDILVSRVLKLMPVAMKHLSYEESKEIGGAIFSREQKLIKCFDSFLGSLDQDQTFQQFTAEISGCMIK